MSHPLDYELAFALMELANEAYQVTLDNFGDGYSRLNGSIEQHPTRESWAAHNGYTLVQNPRGSNAYERFWGIVVLNGSRLVVALRGTNLRWNDFIIDTAGGTLTPAAGASFPFGTWALTVAGQPQTVWAHKNFLATYLLFQSSVRTAVEDILSREGSGVKELYVTGHSLGGALAMLCALDLQLYLSDTYSARPKLSTFAAPYVGDQSFATLLDQQVPVNDRFEVATDLVPWVPVRGWTPQWQAWFEGGKQGDAPPEFASYAKAGMQQYLETTWYFVFSHSLAAYYNAVQAKAPVKANPGFSASDPLNSLLLRIKTSTAIGAGTDSDVSVSLLGMWWGPLDLSWYNDFEQGALDDYDLFTLFPSQKPAGATVGGLTYTPLKFHLGAANRFDFTSAADWKVEYVDVLVNGKLLARLNFEAWIQPGHEIARQITL